MSTQTQVPIDAFREWLKTGERGMSSETIVSHLSGVPISSRIEIPYDPADFRRCERLLRAVPEARASFDNMRTASPTWARLVDAWDALVALSEEEAPGMIDATRPNGRARKLYDRLTEIRQTPAEATR